MSIPVTGLDLFLTNRIYGSKQHPLGWDKYVYDDESIHYGLLQFLSERSPAFVQSILRISGLPKNVSVLPKPEGGLFDLVFLVDGAPTYCEVKVWARLSDAQFSRQIAFLAEKKAKGFYVLFTKAADDWSPELVSKKSAGRCHVVGVADLLKTLDSFGNDLPKEVTEVAVAYRGALNHLNTRWPPAATGNH